MDPASTAVTVATFLASGQPFGRAYILCNMDSHSQRPRPLTSTSHSGQVTGWTGFIRVDGISYIWLGAPNNTNNLATQTAFSYTTTRSIFTLDVAGAVQMVVTFLSPITPSDMKRASLPFSYMNVDVHAIDGKTHDVQLYTDITAGESTATAQTQGPSIHL